MKLVIAAFLSAALIWLHQEQPPANLNNSVTKAAVTKPMGQTNALSDEQPMQEVAEIKPSEPQVPTPSPEPEKVSHPKGCENYRHLISQYDWNTEVFLKIAHAESGCSPSAVGDNRVIGGIYAPSCGLFQVRTLSSRPSCEALKDPATNIAWAYRIYQGQGYKAWSVCRGIVRCS